MGSADSDGYWDPRFGWGTSGILWLFLALLVAALTWVELPPSKLKWGKVTALECYLFLRTCTATINPHHHPSLTTNQHH